MSITSVQEELSRIDREEELAEVERFGHAEALRVGQWIVDNAIADNRVIAVTIFLGEQRVFHAALAGTNHDNDLWLDRKANLVKMYGRSSYYVKNLFLSYGRDFFTDSLHDPHVLAAAGGGFPVRVRGSLVGVIAVSGAWTDGGERAEHELPIAALSALRATQVLEV
ncbi:heme-binding protein [Microbacterium deminutum]|uniref:Heme-degrading domain-containing protein n=1 Tax=Microbacterium deminutum TaxID=344164 RepID=A0ABN2RI13_9MICO